jgi:hypothetical protein
VVVAAIAAGIGLVMLVLAALLGPSSPYASDPRVPLFLLGLFFLSGGGYVMAVIWRWRARGQDDLDITPRRRRP